MVGRHDLDFGYAAAARPDRLAAHFGLAPFTLPLVLARVVEPLDVEVVVVGLCVGHAPCHAGVVAEVGEARAAGEREAEGVEFRAGDVVLVVDVGGVEGPVGIARHEGLARGRAAARQGPVVAPAVGVGQPAHVRCAGRKLRQRVPVAARVGLARRRDEQVAGGVVGDDLSGLIDTELVDEACPPQLALEDAHQDVADLEDGEAVLGPPRVRRHPRYAELDGELSRRLDEGAHPSRVCIEHRSCFGVEDGQVHLDGGPDPEPAHQLVLLDGAVADHLRPPAVGHPPVVLHVPESVLRGGEALAEEGVVGRTGADMRYPVRVPVCGDSAVEPGRVMGLVTSGREAARSSAEMPRSSSEKSGMVTVQAP